MKALLYGLFWAVVLMVLGYAVWESFTDSGKASRAASREQARIQYEQQRNEQLKHTPGMEDCTFHDLNEVTAIRCPNSTTTAEWPVGKGGTQTATTRSN